MAFSPSRGPVKKPQPQVGRAAAAKELVLLAIASGDTVKDACTKANRTTKAYENWRALDPAFRQAVDEARNSRNFIKKTGQVIESNNIDFETWRKKFLKRETYPHMRMWIDILEGRDPTDLHDSMVYEKARPNRLLINTPPYHAKSTIITQEYVVYRITMDPTVRICVISKTQEKAKKFLFRSRRC